MLDLGQSFQAAVKVYQRDVVVYLVSGLIVALLSMVTLGILGGPLHAGLFLMVLRRMRDDKEPQVGDIFSEVGNLGRWVGPFYILGILIFIGSLLLLVPGILIAAFVLFVFPMMLDNVDLPFREAVGSSQQMVKNNGFGAHFAIAAVFVAGLTLVSFVLSLIGTPFTGMLAYGAAMSFFVCLAGVAYTANLDNESIFEP